MLHLTGALNVLDFVQALERRTDISRVEATPVSTCKFNHRNILIVTYFKFQDRYKAFGRMFRQWAFLKRLKRSGRAHDPNGLEATKQGECAVLCWACPHEGINLPPRWQEVDSRWKYLYYLILAMDANFRLCNKLRSRERGDAELGPGWAYFVGSDKYKAYLKDYVSEIDVSPTCS